MEPTNTTTEQPITQEVNTPVVEAVPTAPENATPTETKPQTEDNTTLLGVLSYLGILVLIPFFLKKDDAFVQFHVKQGFVLLAIEIVLFIISAVIGILLPFLLQLLPIIHLLVVVLSIFGIINVIKKEQKELPIVGSYASYIKI